MTSRRSVHSDPNVRLIIGMRWDVSYLELLKQCLEIIILYQVDTLMLKMILFYNNFVPVSLSLV